MLSSIEREVGIVSEFSSLLGSSCAAIESPALEEELLPVGCPLVCFRTNDMYSPEPPDRGVTTTSLSAPPVDLPAPAFHVVIFDMTAEAFESAVTISTLT